MVSKFCSRSHGHPPSGLRRAAMISSRREMSRDGAIGGRLDNVELQSFITERRHYVTDEFSFGQSGGPESEAGVDVRPAIAADQLRVSAIRIRYIMELSRLSERLDFGQIVGN